MNRENLDGETLSRFPLVQGEQIRWETDLLCFQLAPSSLQKLTISVPERQHFSSHSPCFLVY